MIPALTIGGSQIAAILGLSPYQGPLETYAQVVTGAMTESTPAMERGKRLEPVLVQWWAEEHGAAVLAPPELHRGDTPTGWALRHPSRPYIRASLDAVGVRAGLRVLPDAKTAGIQAAEDWGEDGTDDVPLHVILQLSLYGRVVRHLGWDVAPVAEVPALICGDFRLYRVPYDEELGQATEEAATRFWVDHVEPRKPPPPSEPWSDLRGLNRLYRTHSGDAIDYTTLPTHGQEAVRIWASAVHARKAAVLAEAAAEATLKALMGAAPELLSIPEELGTRIDWRQNKPTPVTDWEGVALDLREHYAGPRDFDAVVRSHTAPREGARPLVLREKRKR